MEISEINEHLRPIAVAYMAEVRAIAVEAQRLPDEERSEFVWESVDGNEWVIYTYRAQIVMVISDNDDAWNEDGYEPVSKDSPDTIDWSALAYAAMSKDVWDHVGVLDRETNRTESPPRRESEASNT